MFFYTSLFVASFIVAMVVLWLYKSLVGAGKAIYQAILPSSKSSITDHVKETAVPLTINNARTPWGWEGNASPATLARTHAALPEEKAFDAQSVPWGWKGNKHKVSEYRVKDGIPLKPVTGARSKVFDRPSKTASNMAKMIGWPYREDQFEFAGDTYRVTQKMKPRKTILSESAKPWGW